MTAEEDDLQKSLDLIVERAELLLDRPYLKEMALLQGADDQGEERCEIIETIESVMVIVDLTGSGGRPPEFTVHESSVEVSAPGLELFRALPCRIDTSTVRTELRNGIFSLEGKKVE